ncbi:hypothetical protein P7B02_10610 [Caulobacter segnis]|uniref:hypothetical protein n=1 Tax=Caulobacter segnis TaxID=88688 RepID=UPI00240ED40C|nr:hypothetical protein [Caulobacter segnis]MDG2521990.1 hypothetical protein [Caulobacter segnis]
MRNYAIALILPVALLAACEKKPAEKAAAPAPPKFKLECVMQEGDPPLVLLLDPGASRFTVANVPGGPTGGLATSPYEYRLTVAPGSSFQPGEIVVNRYDGQMRRTAVSEAGPIVQNWMCIHGPNAPRF